MKTLIASILIVINSIIISYTAEAQSVGQAKDFFPLAVGRSWGYFFSADSGHQDLGSQIFYGYTDTGTVIYSVVDSISSQDTTYWAINVSRLLSHHRYDTRWAVDTTWNIHDSSSFLLDEVLSGNHRLIASTMDNNVNPVWAFPMHYCDTNTVTRYQIATDRFSILNICLQTVPWLNILTFYQDSGLTEIGRGYAGNSGGVGQYAILRLARLTNVEVNINNSWTNSFTLFLAPNYPNPFNSTTNIRFTNPIANHFVIHIFNALGQSIATLADKYYPPGTHFISWNADGLSSGLYFIRLSAGNQQLIQKALLIK
jgi:Secretion system C-terminal sorting domain